MAEHWLWRLFPKAKAKLDAAIARRQAEIDRLDTPEHRRAMEREG